MAKYYQKCLECGEHAFEYKTMPVACKPVFADDIIGDDFHPGDVLACQACNLPLSPANLSIKHVVMENNN